jgi:hypothetical protein
MWELQKDYESFEKLDKNGPPPMPDFHDNVGWQEANFDGYIDVMYEELGNIREKLYKLYQKTQGTRIENLLKKFLLKILKNNSKNCTFYGIDQNIDNIKIAKKIEKNVKVQSITKIKDINKYNLIVCSHVIQCLQTNEAFIVMKKFHRSLKKKGFLIVSTLNDYKNFYEHPENVRPYPLAVFYRFFRQSKQIVKSKFSFSGKILELDRYMPEAELEFKNLIDNIKLKIWDRVSFAKSAVGEGEFNKWMQNNTKLSNASMEQYSRAVRKISNDLVKLNHSYSSLEEITANADLEKLKEEYFSIQEFHDLDKRGNRMYSAGFNRLIEFQKSQNST